MHAWCVCVCVCVWIGLHQQLSCCPCWIITIWHLSHQKPLLTTEILHPHIQLLLLPFSFWTLFLFFQIFSWIFSWFQQTPELAIKIAWKFQISLFANFNFNPFFCKPCNYNQTKYFSTIKNFNCFHNKMWNETMLSHKQQPDTELFLSPPAVFPFALKFHKFELCKKKIV